MKSFNTIKKISCAMLGLGMSVSAHAFHIECGDVFGPKDSGKVIKLDRNLFCSSKKNDPEFAIKISGENIKFLLNGHSIKADPDLPPLRGIFITGDNNQVMGPGKVEGFGNEDVLSLTGNIIIENANDNRISQLKINGGLVTGVGISAFGTNNDNIARGNIISANFITGSLGNGISLRGADGGRVFENDVSNNIVRKSNQGISLFSMGVGSIVHDNQAYLNVIQDAVINSINVTGRSSGVVKNNEIYTNLTQRGDIGIRISAQLGGIAENNNAYANVIKEPVNVGIYLLGFSFEAGIAKIIDNRVNDNRIEKPIGGMNKFGIGIRLGGAFDTFISRNLIIKNRIFQPESEAIVLSEEQFSPGSVIISNLVTNNSVEDVPLIQQVFCDNSGLPNTWQINFDNFFPVVGTPDTCPAD